MSGFSKCSTCTHVLYEISGGEGYLHEEMVSDETDQHIEEISADAFTKEVYGDRDFIIDQATGFIQH